MSSPSKQKSRNYRCPRCGGEFNDWHTRTTRGKQHDEKTGKTYRVDSNSEHCPFCDLERGEYDLEGDDA